MKIVVHVAAALVLATAACGQSSSMSADSESSANAKSTRAAGLAGPPPLVLQRPEGDVDLPAYAWCFFDTGVGGCADGPEPANPPQTSATDPLTFTFPLEGWAFTASFQQPGPYVECERVIQIDPVAQGDGTFIVPAPVTAGDWQVQIHGNGSANDGGSLATAFGWTTSGDSMTPAPARGEATFLGPPAVYGGNDLDDVYGPSLALTGLAADPDEATGALVVSGAGTEARYPLHAAKNDACPHDGTIAMTSEQPNKPVDLSDLGDPPYAYEVLLTLDGRQYVGLGQWPDDLAPATSNQLRLAWSPPLPGWTGSP